MNYRQTERNRRVRWRDGGKETEHEKREVETRFVWMGIFLAVLCHHPLKKTNKKHAAIALTY